MQANYYDIVLLIYYIGDYRNATEIAQTWTSFIQEKNREAEAQGEATSWVVVCEEVRSIAKRVSCSETIFNPRK